MVGRCMSRHMDFRQAREEIKSPQNTETNPMMMASMSNPVMASTMLKTMGEKEGRSGRICSLIIACAAILALAASTQSNIVEARPPGESVECEEGGKCRIWSTYGVWPDGGECVAAAAAFPTTEEELVAAVAGGVRRGQKMKVISKGAHSMPKLACPEGKQGLVISTRDLNRRVVVDKERKTAEVDAGVELRQLLDEVAEHGLALPYTPYWQGLSISGLISTGAHGSSLFQKGGAVHEYVVGIRVVVPAPPEDGYARVIVINETTPDLFNAARVSLGVLGAISTVTLQLEPMFKRSITNDNDDDDDMEDRIMDFALAHEFADLTWHPSHKKVVYRKDFRVPMDTDGDAVNDFIGFRPIDPLVIGAVRAVEETLDEGKNAEGKCGTGRIQVATLSALGGGLKNNDILFTGYPVVGLNHRLQTSGRCLTTDQDDCSVCAWDRRIHGEFFHQTTISISSSSVPSFISDIKSLRSILGPSSLCNSDLYYGIIIRFIRKSAAFLGEPDDSASFDITYYRSHDPARPRLNEDVWEEIEQIAVFKYGGRPHWGKNRPVAFVGASAKYPGLSKFLAVKEKLDPKGLFSSSWSDAALGIGKLPLSDSPGCALDGLCICSKDAHCAPHLGYRCRPGRVFSNARVCRHVSDKDDDGLHEEL